MTIHLNRTRVLGAQRQGVADVMYLCGPPARLEILIALAGAPHEVGALANELCRDITHVSHQLRPLRDAGLVKAVRHGSHVMYSLNVGEVGVEESGGAITLTVRAIDGGVVQITLPLAPVATLPHSTAG